MINFTIDKKSLAKSTILIVFMLFLVVFFLKIAFTESQEENIRKPDYTWQDGTWIEDGIVTFGGEKPIQRWDGIYLKEEDLDFSNGDWTYTIKETAGNYIINTSTGSLTIHRKQFNKDVTCDFDLYEISCISVLNDVPPPGLLKNFKIGNVYGTKFNYVPTRACDSGVYDIESESYVNISCVDLDYEISDNSVTNIINKTWFLNANYPVTIYDPWTVPTDSAWSTGTFDNTTEDRGDHHLKLGLLRDNFNDEDEDLTCSATTIKGVNPNGRLYMNTSISGNHPFCYYDDTNFTGAYLYTEYTPIFSSRASGTHHLGLTMRFITATDKDFTKKRNGVKFYINTYIVSTGGGWTFGDTSNYTFWYNESAVQNLSARWNGYVIRSNVSVRGGAEGYVGFQSEHIDTEADNFMVLSVDGAGNPKLDGNYTTATRDSGSGNEAKDVRINISSYDQQKVNVSVYINHTLIQENVTNATVYTIAAGYRTYNITVSLISTDANETPIINTIEVGEGSSSAANAVPSIENTAGIADVSLSANSTVKVWCNATITDTDGCSEIENAWARLYNITDGYGTYTGLGSGTFNFTTRYINDSCILEPSCTGTTRWANCSFDIQFYATYGNSSDSWACNMTVNDSSDAAASNQSLFDINQLIAIGIKEEKLEFSETLYPGNTGTYPENITIVNIGNTMAMDVVLNETDPGADAGSNGNYYELLQCNWSHTTGTGVINTSIFVQYNETNASFLFGDEGLAAGGTGVKNLTGGDVVGQTSDLNIDRNSSEIGGKNSTVYWKIRIPTTDSGGEGGLSGTCNGTVTFVATQ